jgi:tetratricopeptide (TPR) repeat protein
MALTAFLIWRHFDEEKALAPIKQAFEKGDTQQGMQLCNAAIAKYPGNAYFHFYKGRFLCKLPNMRGAVQEFNRALSLAPNDPQILDLRGTANLILNRPRRAHSDFEQLFANKSYIASLPPDKRANAYANKADAEAFVLKFKPAVEDLSQAIKLAPKNLQLYKALARALAGDKQYDKAIKQWNDIIAQQPKDPLNYVERARVEFAASKQTAGNADISKSISIKPTAEAYDLKATQEHSLHEKAAAIADESKATKLAPGQADLHQKRISYLAEEGKLNDALPDLVALERNRKYSNEWLTVERAKVRMKNKRFARAAGDFTLLLKKHPRDYWYHVWRGDCYARSGKIALAEEDYTAALNQFPKAADLYSKRAACYVKQGKTQLAENDFAQSIKLYHESPSSYLARGICYGDNHQYDQAIADMRQVLKKQPNNKVARQKLAEYEKNHSRQAVIATDLPPLPKNLDKNNPATAGAQLLATGRTDLAIKKFGEALKKEPNNPELRRYIANAFVRMGRPGDAAAQYQALSQLHDLYPADQLKFAHALADSGNTGSAARALQQYCNRMPSDVEARLYLAELYGQLGPAGEGLFRNACMTGIRLARNKDDQNRFRSLLDGKSSSQVWQRNQQQLQGKFGGG